MADSPERHPLLRLALKLLFLQHSYVGVVSLPLIWVAKVNPSNALVISYCVAAIAVARRHPASFPPRPRRSEGLALVGMATLLFWPALALFMHVYDPDALPRMAHSLDARLAVIRVVFGYPAMTFVGLAIGGKGMRTDNAPPDLPQP